jgi:hypothetical protein
MKTLRRRMPMVLVIVVTAAIASCVDAGSRVVSVPQVPSELGFPKSPTLLGINFLGCTPITADSVTQAVDSSGGTIAVGPHQLVIPAGALDTAVSITAIVPSDTVNRVQLYPEGLEFGKKVYLTMSYANCAPLSILIPKRVVHVDSNFNVLDLVASIDSLVSTSVTAKLHHFSDYVVAW